ncbi:MAG: HypC/HybG/HupF family hydrogenase formation chaperone [Actinomycetota bacterium]
MCLGIPGEIVEIVDPVNDIAKIDVGGVKRNVNIGLLKGDDAVGVGDWVLIHVGFALSKMDAEQAASTLDFLEGLGEEYEDELEQLKNTDIA